MKKNTVYGSIAAASMAFSATTAADIFKIRMVLTFARPFEWAGYDDGDCSGKNFAIWAPDIIWNPCWRISSIW